MTKIQKCEICKEREYLWAMQFIGEDTPTFYRPGYHERGFRVYKICDTCKKEFEERANEK